MDSFPIQDKQINCLKYFIKTKTKTVIKHTEF